MHITERMWKKECKKKIQILYEMSSRKGFQVFAQMMESLISEPSRTRGRGQVGDMSTCVSFRCNGRCSDSEKLLLFSGEEHSCVGVLHAQLSCSVWQPLWSDTEDGTLLPFSCRLSVGFPAIRAFFCCLLGHSLCFNMDFMRPLLRQITNKEKTRMEKPSNVHTTISSFQQVLVSIIDDRALPGRITGSSLGTRGL